MASPRDVAIVILNWNGWGDTRECLLSLRQAAGDFGVVLVDNGSTDESVEMVRKEFPEVEVVENGRNLGFAEGNNRGIEFALSRGAEFVGVLNNDTTVAPDFLEPLLDELDGLGDIAFASPRIFYADPPDKVWFFGSEIDWRTGWVYHRQLADSGPAGGSYATPTATGCCVIAPRETWRHVGLFDERYFLYWEDADWTLRVVRAGGRGHVVAGSRIWHKVARSFDRSASSVGTFYFVRNGLLFIRKHGRSRVATSIRFLSLWAARPTIREVRRRDRGWLRALALRAAAVLAFLVGSYGAAPRLVMRLAARPRT
jgi:GT2 family glycosyltransferase